MKILFISRAYPPVVGGIENHNFELAKRLLATGDATLLVNTRGKKFLPFFLPYALIRIFFTARRYDAILLGDGVLSIIGFFATLVSKKTRVAAVLHGLDITYRNPVYQILWVHLFIPSLNVLIAVSEETKNKAIQYGLDEKKITVVPNGVAIPYTPEKYSRADLSKLLGFDTTDKTILLTHGRLAKRKGAAWFLQNVLPGLPPTIHYVLSGDGPERDTLEQLIQTHGLEERVTLLGKIPDDTKLTLLHTIDIFIQPNITVPGDMEGFGIAVIEATSCARPLIASDMEGLKQALAHGENGIALPSGDTRAWRDTIIELSRDAEKRMVLGKKFQQYTRIHFAWDTLTKQYLAALQK